MFKEELNLIKSVEAEADAMRKDSKMEAKALVEEANTNALRLMEEAKAKAKEIVDGLSQEGQELAQKQYEDAVKACEVKCAELEASAKTKESNVVSKIVERVKSSVN